MFFKDSFQAKAYYMIIVFLEVGSFKVEPLQTDTSLVRTLSDVPTKFSHIFFRKNLGKY